MTDAALSLCRATRYEGAGTVEFIVDTETQKFFFLEMNTCIQVAHPMTEMVTGVDLVAMQIEFASGTLASANQADISVTCHAVECRLYAEKPQKNFLPSRHILKLGRKLKPGIGSEAWFCDPQAPWQKGLVENLNKRARRYLPRDTQLAALSPSHRLQANDCRAMYRSMTAICDRLNGTSRKCLGWRTPNEAFREEMMKLR